MTISSNDSGSYLLIIKLQKACALRIGALGEVLFKSGYYVYAGSAKRGLRARIARHLRDEKNIRWHIDYLLETAHVERVVTSTVKSELQLAQALIASSHFKVVDRFGASDSPLPGHLLHCPEAQSSNDVIATLPSKVRSVTDEYVIVVS